MVQSYALSLFRLQLFFFFLNNDSYYIPLHFRTSTLPFKMMSQHLLLLADCLNSNQRAGLNKYCILFGKIICGCVLQHSFQDNHQLYLKLGNFVPPLSGSSCEAGLQMLLPRLELLCGSQEREVEGSLTVTSQI